MYVTRFLLFDFLWTAVKAFPVKESIIIADNENNVEAGNESLLQELDLPTTSAANPTATPSLNKNGKEGGGTQPQNVKAEVGVKQDETLRFVTY